ncbi:hypothetical protein DUNSADRAFT_18100 [Dunaliella salina]|uniref:Uncharacterized protein n=1 Tax=Dunaliella salina TaxID=3046 RepID=A0ABQ7G0M7_DUNSA|nr:hypothetical protein DUNSADRAFT_18100 [Dunaliella salina]|eukprot:KAF5828160.1 hypothetical protein DUNSADRAFT_18100 [Dunaliella salina]
MQGKYVPELICHALASLHTLHLHQIQASTLLCALTVPHSGSSVDPQELQSPGQFTSKRSFLKCMWPDLARIAPSFLPFSTKVCITMASVTASKDDAVTALQKVLNFVVNVRVEGWDL